MTSVRAWQANRDQSGRRIFVVDYQNDASDPIIERRRETAELEEQEGPPLARCHHPLSGPPAARPPHPSPANLAGGRIPALVPPCTTTNRLFVPRTALIPLATLAGRQPTDRERSSWQVCCPCFRAPRAARREAQSSTPTAVQVRCLPSKAGPTHATDTLSHGRSSSHLTATTLLTTPVHSLASLAGSRRRRGRRVLRPHCSRMWAVFGVVRAQR